YAGWHIRTSDGETSNSYYPSVHRYIFVEAPETVVSAYSRSMSYAAKDMILLPRDFCKEFQHTLHQVHISLLSPLSCSQEMKKASMNQPWNVSFVELQLAPRDIHTAYSRNKSKAGVNAFLDFFFLMDSTLLLRCGSSFSGVIVIIKNNSC
ncbi:unnamed protein product, partial [Choristocarpus tenellus]